MSGLMAEDPEWFPTIEVEGTEESAEEAALRELREHQRLMIEGLRESEDHIREAWRFFRDVLGSPVYWCAPMVGASELAFRMMVRKYGADIATTPMISAGGYVQNAAYRELYQFHPGTADRPLIVQFWSNRGDSLLEAARLVEDHCDAIEINLGCPQPCARSAHYGSFLMRCPEILYEMVSAVAGKVKVPVLCKVRVFKDYQQTLQMCQMLQNAGASVITVHGRTKEQRRSAVHLADWDVIARLKQDLRVPVISNGNIKNWQDMQDCLAHTKCDGVMSACALLANPALFAMDRDDAQKLTPFQLALEYVRFAEEYGANAAQIRKHVFSILRKPLNVHTDIGKQLLLIDFAPALDFPHIRQLILEVEQREVNRLAKAETTEHQKRHHGDGD